MLGDLGRCSVESLRAYLKLFLGGGSFRGSSTGNKCLPKGNMAPSISISPYGRYLTSSSLTVTLGQSLILSMRCIYRIAIHIVYYISPILNSFLLSHDSLLSWLSKMFAHAFIRPSVPLNLFCFPMIFSLCSQD